MNEDKRKFTFDLIKIIVDKLLIGAIVVILGFVGNFLLEKYKSEVRFSEKINETRVANIGTTWEQVNIIESLYDQLKRPILEEMDMFIKSLEFKDSIKYYPADTNMDPFQKDSIHAYRIIALMDTSIFYFNHFYSYLLYFNDTVYEMRFHAKAIVDQNRFWIGENEHAHLSYFLSAFDEYLPEIKISTDKLGKWIEGQKVIDYNYDSVLYDVRCGIPLLKSERVLFKYHYPFYREEKILYHENWYSYSRGSDYKIDVYYNYEDEILEYIDTLSTCIDLVKNIQHTLVKLDYSLDPKRQDISLIRDHLFGKK